jgi:hypothetical protein
MRMWAFDAGRSAESWESGQTLLLRNFCRFRAFNSSQQILRFSIAHRRVSDAELQ